MIPEHKELLGRIYQHENLKPSDVNRIIDAHELIRFPAEHSFLKEGQVMNAYYIMVSGVAHSYAIDYEGRMISTEFFNAGDIVIDVLSLFRRQPSAEHIVSISEGSAYVIPFDKFQLLFQEIGGFMEWGRAWMSLQLFTSKQRSLDMITLSAQDRYLKILNEEPKIVQTVPLKYIASYLGITNSSLSRIRREIS